MQRLRRRGPREPVRSSAAETVVVEEGVPGPAPPPEGPPPDRELWPWLLVLLVLVLAGLAGAWFATRGAKQRAAPAQTVTTLVTTARASTTAAGAKVAVPSVVGLKAARALATLEQARLRSTVRSVASRDPKGTVAAQRPAAGARVASGTLVALAVSKGMKVSVPGLVGQTEADAVKTVEAAGLKPDVHRVPSSEPQGTVVAQHPQGGEQVATGAGVLLNVSRGAPTSTRPAKAASKPAPPPAQKPKPAAVSVTVPDLVGTSLSSARARITAAGLKPDVAHVPSRQPRDTVVSQSPQGGSTAKRGAGVLINVSLGPAKHGTTTSAPRSQQPAQATVPDVTGEDVATARSDLQAAGFTVSVVYEPTTDQSQDGVVTDETPAGGTRANANATVTITVAQYSGG